MTDTEIRDAITANCDGAKAYRLIQERAGVLYYDAFMRQDKPPLNLFHLSMGGATGLIWRCVCGRRWKEFLREHRVNVVVESLFPIVHENVAAPLAMEAAGGRSLIGDREARRRHAPGTRNRSCVQRKPRLYANFQRALGTHSATALRIEHERIELMAKSTRTMLETQAQMHEMSRQLIRKNKTPPPPPPPPNWEKIIAAGAPALAAMYTATLAAITKTAPVKVSGLAEPLAPEKRNSNSSTRHLATFRAMSGWKQC